MKHPKAQGAFSHTHFLLLGQSFGTFPPNTQGTMDLYGAPERDQTPGHIQERLKKYQNECKKPLAPERKVVLDPGKLVDSSFDYSKRFDYDPSEYDSEVEFRPQTSTSSLLRPGIMRGNSFDQEGSEFDDMYGTPYETHPRDLSIRPGLFRGESFTNSSDITEEQEAEVKKTVVSLLDNLVDRDPEDDRQDLSFMVVKDKYLTAIEKLRPDSMDVSLHKNSSLSKEEKREQKKVLLETQKSKMSQYEDLKNNWISYETVASDKPEFPSEVAVDIQHREETVANAWTEFAEGIVEDVQNNSDSESDDDEEDLAYWIAEAKRLKAAKEQRKRAKRRVQEHMERARSSREAEKAEETSPRGDDLDDSDSSIDDIAGHLEKKRKGSAGAFLDDSSEDGSDNSQIGIGKSFTKHKADASHSTLSFNSSLQGLDSSSKSLTVDPALPEVSALGENDDLTDSEDRLAEGADAKADGNKNSKDGKKKKKKFEAPKTPGKKLKKKIPKKLKKSASKKGKALELDSISDSDASDQGVSKKSSKRKKKVKAKRRKSDLSSKSKYGTSSESEESESSDSDSDSSSEKKPSNKKKNNKKTRRKSNAKSNDENSDDEHVAPLRNLDGTPWKNVFKAWMNKPKKVKSEGTCITVPRVPQKSDCWRKTRHNFILDNAPFYWHKVAGDFEVVCKLSGTFSSMYDKAGLMVRLDAENWVTSGMECFNDMMNHSTCITKDVTDWSLAPLPPNVEKDGIWFAIKRIGDSIEAFYSLEGRKWVQTRQGIFSKAPVLKVGIVCACPMGEPFKVNFDMYRCKNI